MSLHHLLEIIKDVFMHLFKLMSIKCKEINAPYLDFLLKSVVLFKQLTCFYNSLSIHRYVSLLTLSNTFFTFLCAVLCVLFFYINGVITSFLALFLSVSLFVSFLRVCLADVLFLVFKPV